MEIDPQGLLPYQVPQAVSLARAIQRNGGAIDASDMGVGKTYAACAVLKAFDLPSLVVCPEVAETSWLRAGAHIGVEFDVLNYEALRTGRTPFGWWDNPPPPKLPTFLKCRTCQCIVPEDGSFRCPYHMSGIHCVDVKRKEWNYGRFNYHPGVKFVVFDEAHRVGATDSLNCDMALAIKRQGIKFLGLSATLGDSPLHFRAIGYILGLHGLLDRPGSVTPGFWRWAKRHGCRPGQFGGLEFGGSRDVKKVQMAKLNAELFPAKGARIRVEHLGDAFPKRQITAEAYDIQDKEKAARLHAAMQSALAALQEARKLDKDPEGPLTTLLRSLQEVELLKVPILHKLTEDARAQGYSVALFVNYTQTLNELCTRLKISCRIDGTQVGPAGARRRQLCIDAFQSNAERIIACNTRAGGIGVSLHDLHGGFPRIAFVSPAPSAVDMRQVFGRLHRQGAQSPALYRVVLLAGTPEASMQTNLNNKFGRLDALNNGDLMPSNYAELTEKDLDALCCAS